MECSKAGCGTKLFSGLLCRKHYEEERLSKAAPCSISGCDKRAFRGSMCETHYRKHLLDSRPSCIVPGCCNPQKNLTSGYCGKHESRVRNHATIDPLRPNDWGSREKHPMYKTWTWHRRGVNKMCREWHDDFWSFVTAVGDKPDGHTLRRHDAAQPLGPTNWYWKESVSSSDAAAYQREWRNRNPEKAKNIELKKMYGIDLATYEAMLDRQGGVCAICQKPESTKHRDGGPRRMPVDHCHKTGKIRGLLCTHCNRALGMFGDSEKTLRAAIDYLASFCQQ